MFLDIVMVAVTEFVLIFALLHTQVKNWVKELRKMLGNEICLCIVGKHHYFLKDRHLFSEYFTKEIVNR